MRRPVPATHALLCFEEAARLESLTRAAQALSLTQSAISRQITALDELVGKPLFRLRTFLRVIVQSLQAHRPVLIIEAGKPPALPG